MIASTTSPAGTPRRFAEAVPPELTLESGLPVNELEARIALAHAGAGLCHRALAFYLHEVEVRGLYKRGGCRTVPQYAEARFGISRREGRDLVRAGRKLETLSKIDEAFCRHELSFSKVRELVKVVVPETEQLWLDKALASTIGELILAVKLAREGEPPRDPDDRKGLPEIRLKLVTEVPPDVHAKWEKVREKLDAEAGRPLRGWECLDTLCDLLLSTRKDGTVPGREPIDESHYTVVVTAGSADPANAVGRGDVATVDTKDGPVPVSDATAAMLECDGCVQTLATDGTSRGERKTPPALRRRVLARDGHRCRSCRSRYRLQEHHVVPWSEGGPTVMWNLVTLCRTCHALVHENLVEVISDGRQVDDPGFRFVSADGRDLHGPDDFYRGLVVQHLGGVRRLAMRPPACENGESAARCAAPGTAPTAARFSDLIGQEKVTATLQRAIGAARRRGRPPGHVLLSGPAGLGKTMIARATADEMGVPFHAVAAPAIPDRATLDGVLQQVGSADVLFVDEIHALPPVVAETLYESLDAGTFTLIGATTEPGTLRPAFRSRFRYDLRLTWYAPTDLARILRRGAGESGVEVTAEAALRLARVSRGTPRRALHLLGLASDEALDQDLTTIGAAVAARTLDDLGIDRRGLDPVDRAYLDILARLGTVSLGRAAAALGVDAATLADDHEPHLARLGLISVTPRGRRPGRVAHAIMRPKRA